MFRNLHNNIPNTLRKVSKSKDLGATSDLCASDLCASDFKGLNTIDLKNIESPSDYSVTNVNNSDDLNELLESIESAEKLIVDFEFSQVYSPIYITFIQIYLLEKNLVAILNVFAIYDDLLEVLPNIFQEKKIIMFGMENDILALQTCFNIYDPPMVFDYQEVIKALNTSLDKDYPIGLKKLMDVFDDKAPSKTTDYRKKHIKWLWLSPLTNEQIVYAINDVIGLCDVINKLSEYLTDDIMEIANTSSSHKLKKRIKKGKKIVEVVSLKIIKNQIDLDNPYVLQEDFRKKKTLIKKILKNLNKDLNNNISRLNLNLNWIKIEKRENIILYVLNLYKTLFSQDLETLMNLESGFLKLESLDIKALDSLDALDALTT